MCKYCERDTWGERLMKINMDGVDVGDLMDVFTLELWIVDEMLQAQLCTHSGDEIKTLDTPINYCPFCGKQLESSIINIWEEL